MRRLILTLSPLALTALAGALMAADNFRVAAKNDLGRKNSNESNARIRYAVVDLGTSQKPTRITNSGIVLFGDTFSAKRWANGKLESLARGYVRDISEDGTAVGWISSNEFYSASSFRLRSQPSTPFTEVAAVWTIGQTAAQPLDAPQFDFDLAVKYFDTYGFLGYTLEPYACSSADGDSFSGYWGQGYTVGVRFAGSVKESRAFTIDHDGAIYGEAVPPSGFQTRGDCPGADFFGALIDGFGWGGGPSGQLGTSRLELDATGRSFYVSGEVRKVTKARNGHTIGFSSGGGAYSDLLDGTPVSYPLLNLNSRGWVLTAMNAQYAIADPSMPAQPVVTAISGRTNVYAFNYREVPTVDLAGNLVARPSPQFVGHDYDYYSDVYDYRVGTIHEEDGATGKYVQTKLNNLISHNSGWHISYAYDINDSGWIIGNGWYQQRDSTGAAVGSPQWRACLLVPLKLDLLSPSTDARYPYCDDVLLNARVEGPFSSAVSRVEYCANGAKVGESIVRDGWGAVWIKPPVGRYTVTAKTSLDVGGIAESVGRTVTVLPLTRQAVQLIYDYEVGGGKAYYEQRLSRPTVPGTKSGVTIGVGYDLRFQTSAGFEKDWGGLLPQGQIDRLKRLTGQVGTADMKDSVQDIVIPWTAAERVFYNTTVPRYVADTLRAYPDADTKLSPTDFGSLVSMVLNRGSGLTNRGRSSVYAADPSREMRQIADALKSGNHGDIPQYLRDMKRLWPDLASLPREKKSEHLGLRRRRDREASLFEQYLNIYGCN